MTEYTSYEIAREALKRAEAIVDFDGGVTQHLENAEKIRLWLFEKGELVETRPEPEGTARYVYLADEEPNEDGTYPFYTYWYRYDRTTREVSRMNKPEPGGAHPQDDLSGKDLDALFLELDWLSEAPVSAVPEWAR